MRLRIIRMALAVTAVLAILAAGWLTWGLWRDGILPARPGAAPGEGSDGHGHSHQDTKLVRLGPLARANLRLIVKPVRSQTYWRTIQVPGTIVERRGRSDRGVTTPIAGVVRRAWAVPGDTVRPGDELVTLRLTSETLQASQTELYKAAQNIKIGEDRLKRTLAAAGSLPERQLREARYEIQRLEVTRKAHRQDLATRGLAPEQIDEVERGNFLKEITIRVPGRPAARSTSGPGELLEVEELKVHLGGQAQAGQILCVLANHQSLFVEGRGFRREAPLLERAARNGWPVRADFSERGDGGWLPLKQELRIRHLANTIDPSSRTLAFYLPLTNQSRAFGADGQTFLVWRFRPGQRVRLRVPVETMKDVIVLPVAAVAREGPEAYVFRQNGDLFDRLPVHVLHEDRLEVVLAKGSVAPGWYIAHNAAASLNRVLKAQNSSGGLPPGFHVHPDGTMHGPH